MPVMVLPRALVTAALLCFAIIAASADVAVPPLKARVTDLTGTLSAERIAELEATTARKGNRKVKLEVSGHVNEALFA